MPENAAENDAPDVTPARGTTLVRALLELQREKMWGTVDVEGGGTRTRIYVADGKPVSATEGTQSDALGRLLMREGALTAAQYNSILARMVENLGRGRAMRFGEAAVSLGLLTSKQVQEALAAQVKQKVARCIALSHSTFTFTQSRDWANKVRRFPSTVEPLVLYAAASFDRERTDAILRPGAGTRARLSKKAGDTAFAFALGPAELHFLSMIDGRRTVRELLGEDEVDASAILVALALSDHLAIVDASRPVAEEPQQSEPPPPRVSYAELIRERHHNLVSFTAAKTPLGANDSGARAPDVSGLEPKSPEQARLIADVVFTLGAGYLRSNSLARAAEELRRAAELVPDSREYTLFAKWAEFANEQAKLETAEKGAALASLEVSAEAALEQVTDLGFAHYVLGQVYLNEGDEERALRSFKRAARLDPELIDADRHVRLLELRRRRSSAGEMAVVAAVPEKPAAPADKPTVPAPPLAEVATAPPPAAGSPPPVPVVASPPPVPVVASPAPAPIAVAPAPHPVAAAPRPPPPIARPAPPRAAPLPVEPKVIIAPLTPPLPMMIAPPPPQEAPPVVTAIAPPAVAEPPNEVPAATEAQAALAALPEVPAPLDTNEPIETGAVVPSLYPPMRARGRMAVTIASAAIALVAAIGVAGLTLHHFRAKSDALGSPAAETARAPEPAAVTAAAVTAAAMTAAAPTTTQAAEVATAKSSAPSPSTSAAPTHATEAAAAASSSDSYGMVQTSRPTSSGHRITVDGHSIGDAPGPFRVRCGSHKVQIGSHGKPHRVEIACGGTTDLD